MCIWLQYIPRNMHTVFALLCFVVVIHWLIFSYPTGLHHWHCGNLTIAPVPANQPWWIWINTSCEFIMNDCITTTKQSTTKTCAYFLEYTVLTHAAIKVDLCTYLKKRSLVYISLGTGLWYVPVLAGLLIIYRPEVIRTCCILHQLIITNYAGLLSVVLNMHG